MESPDQPKLVRRAITTFGRWNRGRKAMFVRRFVEENAIRSVLFVGVGEGWTSTDFIVEAAAGDRVPLCVACDMHARSQVPWSYVCASGLALPFPDASFDLVLSNAVIEHVGGEDDQALFIKEHVRVGGQWIITTPNRWFPVEAHTGVPFMHWKEHWRRQRGHIFTRLLSRRELRKLLPANAKIKGRWYSPTFLASSIPTGSRDRARVNEPSRN